MAELMVHPSMARFDAARASALRLRSSVIAEVSLIVFAYIVGVHYIWPRYGAPPVAIWYATPAEGGGRLTAAGWWFAQSLANMSNSFEVVWGMRVVPFTRYTLLQLAVITLLPVAPLLLTMFSPQELFERLLRVAFRGACRGNEKRIRR